MHFLQVSRNGGQQRQTATEAETAIYPDIKAFAMTIRWIWLVPS